MNRALILHTHVSGLGVIRALGEMGVPVVAMYYEDREMGYLSKFVIKNIRVPHPEIEENEFIKYLLSYGEKFSDSILIPTNDFMISTVSRYKDLLEKYYIVAVPSWEITKKVLIKKYTYEIASSIGIPHPKTYIPKSIEDIYSICRHIDFPYLLKPCEGHKFFETFGTKMFEVNNQEQALFYYNKAKENDLEVMIQELIPGNDTNGINYNSYFVDDKPIAEFTARKVRLDPPRFGSPRVLISEWIPEIIETGRKLINATGFHGFSCAEFKFDTRDGQYKLMEVNGRHNLTSSLAVRCGMNFPWIMYQHLVYDRILPIHDFEERVYWIDLYKDLKHSLFSRKYENFTFADYVRPYCRKKVFAVLCISDLLPFLKRHWYIVKKIYRSIMSVIAFKSFKVNIENLMLEKNY